MSTSGSSSNNNSFVRGVGSLLSKGTKILVSSVTPKNLALGANQTRTPKLIRPTAGTTEVFSVRSTTMEDDHEVYNFRFGVAGDCVDTCVFIARYEYVISSFTVRYAVASTSGTVTLDVVDSGEAPSAGTSALSTTVSLSSTADTNISGTLSTTQTDRLLSAGQSLALNFGGTMTSIIGLVVSVSLRRVNEPRRFNNYLE